MPSDMFDQLYSNMSINENDSQHNHVIVYVNCYQSKEEYHLYGAHYVILYTVWILVLLLIIPITLSNMFAVRVFMKKEQMCNNSNILLLHTALCDAMFGCVAMPIWSTHLGHVLIGRTHNCTVLGFSLFFALVLPWMSFLTTFLIAFDKHLAIFHSYLYESRIKTRKQMFIVPLLSFWIIVVMLQMTWYFTKVPLLQRAAFIIPVLVSYSIYIHVRVYITVRNTRIAIRKSKVSRREGSSDSRGKSADDLKDVRAARLTAFMLASLCICYLPYFALQVSRIAYGNELNASMHTALPVVLLIGATKCVINPLLYYHQKQAIRDSVSTVSVRFSRTMEI